MTNNHGGPRDGAGRKPMPGTVMKSIKLAPELWERAKKIGAGNASEGIRRALGTFIPNEKTKRIALAYAEGIILGIGDSEEEARNDAERFWDYEWTIDEALASDNPDRRISYVEVEVDEPIWPNHRD